MNKPSMSEHSLHPTMAVDYLVGGFRISLDEESNTPGPRSHIQGFSSALMQLGHPTNVLLASELPGMQRFTKIRQSDYKSASNSRLWIADFIRLGASIWSGLNVSRKTILRPTPAIIYERVAVFQSLTSFHARKKTSFRIAEANGILSRETARDRKALKNEWYARWLERKALQHADLVIAVSANLKDELIKFSGVADAKILVVPNGVEKSFCNMPRVRPSHGHRVLGFVGSVVPWQHLDRLIKSASVINRSGDQNEEVYIEIIGDGPEVQALRDLVHSLDMENQVEFLGRLSHSEAICRMSSWDIGYAGHEKSSSETMYHSPLKIYEYAALGISVLCTPSADADKLKAAGSLMYFFDSPDVLETATMTALEERKGLTEAQVEIMRQSVALRHSWEQRAQFVVNAVMERMGSSANKEKRGQ